MAGNGLFHRAIPAMGQHIPRNPPPGFFNPTLFESEHIMALNYYEAIDAEVANSRAQGGQMSRYEAAKIVTARDPSLRPDTISGTTTATSAPYRGTSALDQFNAAIESEMSRRPGITRASAAIAANKKNPGLRQRVLAETS